MDERRHVLQMLLFLAVASADMKPPILPEGTHVPDEEGAAKMRAEAEATNKEPEKFSPQETGMFYKEVGEMIRAGKLPSKNKDRLPNTRNHALQLVYFNRMCQVLGVKEN